MEALQGIPSAGGLAIGIAHVIRPAPPIDVTAQRTTDPSIEIARLEGAIGQAIGRMDALRSTASGLTADILEAQREMLDDPELKQGADDLISSGFTAEAAITRVAADYAAQLAELPDQYLAARADDVREAGRRIVAELQGISLEIRLDHAAILVAQDLAPAETVGLNPAHLQAVVTETGSATGHLAIVAQGLGIPAVVGVAGALAQIDEGTTLVVDGDRGMVTIAPDEASRSEAEIRLVSAQRDRENLEI